MLFDIEQEATYDFLPLKSRTLYLNEIKISINVSTKSKSASTEVVKVIDWLDIWKYLNPELGLADYPLKEGVFNQNAEKAVKVLQEKWGMPANGIVDPVFFSLLSSPMAVAFQRSLIEIESIREAIVYYAQQHRASVPLETIKGNNYGPWVKAYLNLNKIVHTESNTHDWCAAFVCTILDQAFSHFNEDYTDYMDRTAWVPDISAYAYKNNLIVPYDQANDRIDEIRPGDIFMKYDPKNSLWLKTGTPQKHRYIHTGLIEKVEGSIITTIEGNKNFGGKEPTLQKEDPLYVESGIPDSVGGVFSRQFDLSDPKNMISVVTLNV